MRPSRERTCPATTKPRSSRAISSGSHSTRESAPMSIKRAAATRVWTTLLWIPWERIQYAGDLFPSSGYLRLSSGRRVLSGGLTSLLPV